MQYKFKGFTLIELLAVIAILAIILLIAVPKVMDAIGSARKSAFENDYMMIKKAIVIEKVKDFSFDVSTINESNIESILGINGDNYKRISIIEDENDYIISITGQNAWSDLIVYGSSGEIEVVNLKEETVIETFDIGLDLTGNLYSDGTLIISGTGEPYQDYEIDNGQDNIKKVFFEEGITAISNYMFAGITSLEVVILPNSLITIGEAAFYNCTSLRTVLFGNDLNTIGVAAFNSCTSLEKVILGNEVTAILDSSFANCSSLTKVNLNNSPAEIDVAVFNGCISLTEFRATSVLSIGQAVFAGCGLLSEVELGNQITLIDNASFAGTTSLKEITIPQSVVSSSWAFQGSGITEAIIYATNIPNSMFKGASALENVIIKDSVLTIGENVFEGLTLLENVSIGNSVTTIGSDAFSGCTSLTEITIPESVVSTGYCIIQNSGVVTATIYSTNISDEMFMGASMLENVIFKNNVTHIGEMAFSSLDSLELITIPSSVTTIDDYAFAWNSNLKGLYFEGNAPTTVGVDIFEDVHSTFKSYYHSGATGFSNPWNSYPTAIY